MNLFITLRIALQALARNSMRTGLTILGIMVGIGAVVCTVALGNGSAARVHNDLLNLGESFVWLENGSRVVGGARTGAGGANTLTADDMNAILAEVPGITRCSPQVDARTQVVNGTMNWSTTYRGVTPDYLQIRRWAVASGGVFTDNDVETRTKVAVLGATVAAQLFGEDDPVDQVFRLGTHLFRVVGVLQAKGSSTTGQNQDDFILIPYTVAQHALKGTLTLDDVMCSAKSDAAIGPAQEQIVDLMRDRHRIGQGQPDDFNIQKPDEQIRMREDAAATMGTMLAGIAAISLAVGGVGIMNIMLVSVAERTREIGLRMAIGARGWDVSTQFLVEALLLGMFGGAAGILAGLIGSAILSGVFGWDMAVSTNTIVAAVTFASSVGLVFGYYPARHAASLDPIEALRSE
jgi:putative ABC transport system permease protein